MSDYLAKLREAVPEQLRELPVWLAWRSICAPGEKPRKVPYYCDGAPRHGALDSPEDRARLVTFDQAAATFDPARFTGLGIALGDVPGEEITLAGIDLDDVREDDPRVLEVLGAAASYAEVSPSGKGIKIFGTGDIGTAKVQRDGAGLEIYSRGRFFTVTGDRVNGAHVADLAEAAELARKRWQTPAPTAPRHADPIGGSIIAGGRNNTLASLAGALRRRGGSLAAIEAAVLAENAARCSPPLPEDEVRAIARSVARYEPTERPAAEPAGNRFDLEAARVGLHTFDCPPAPPEHIVQDHTLRTVGAFVGPGGLGKTTLKLCEAVHIVLGRPLYGLEVMRPGPVLYLTAEDEAEIARWRLARIVQDMHLSRPELEHVAANVLIEDATRFPCRFVDADQGGRLIRTRVLDELAEAYQGARLSAIFADPQNAFGPGERFVNDGEAELMRAGAWLSRELNCAVQFVHHVGKANARGGIVDQYAGRGGSAGADNARFVHVLAAHLADGEGFTAPSDATPEEMAEGRILRLHVAKLSHGKKPGGPTWLRRVGFTFEHLRPSARDAAEIERSRLRTLHGFIRDQAAAGIRHTGTTLEDRLAELGMTRAELRAALHVALERRHLTETEAPEGERRGRRKTYLAAGITP